jgi:hypothetical protein
MNGHTAMPTLGFGQNCTYDVLDSILNANVWTGYEVDGQRYGWSVRIWCKQGVCITALWGVTDYIDNGEHSEDMTDVLAWSFKHEDYCTRISIPTDDIVRLEIL